MQVMSHIEQLYLFIDLFINFLANRTAARRQLGYWHESVIFLSVSFCLSVSLSVCDAAHCG